MAQRVSQQAIEAIILDASVLARASQYVVEAILTDWTAPPGSLTGAAVSQQAVEVLLIDASVLARASQYVVEAIVQDGDWSPPGGGAGGVRVYGWAG